jgi:alkanesulfonate monooxygenase SsuD/methylene tetrahydromethanopterin reductase-like flavin-dependent oxidoreductase (luciferase family)
MRFDGNVNYHVLISPEDYAPDKIIDEWRETARFYEEAGFTTIWVAEHHFWYGGNPAACIPTNPVLVGAHLATHTKRLRVGQSACIIPDWHPIRLAEDLAMVDQMTQGRLDIGIARGTNSAASIQFNVNADRRDQDKNYALFRETLEILMKAWTQDAFTHKGEFYTFPQPGWKEPDPRIYASDPSHYAPDGELIALGVAPKPYQKPHPPIWQAADATPSYAFAAEKGIAAMSVFRSFEGLREAWTTYKEVASRISGRDIPMGQTASGQTLGVLKPVYVAETQEEADKVARPLINSMLSFTTGRREGWARKGVIAADEKLTDDDLNAEWFDFLQDKEMIWVGTPDFVAEKIDRLRSELNCQHVTLWPNPIVSFEHSQRSFELFAERVMPRFQRQEAAAAV